MLATRLDTGCRAVVPREPRAVFAALTLRPVPGERSGPVRMALIAAGAVVVEMAG